MMLLMQLSFLIQKHDLMFCLQAIVGSALAKTLGRATPGRPSAIDMEGAAGISDSMEGMARTELNGAEGMAESMLAEGICKEKPA